MKMTYRLKPRERRSSKKGLLIGLVIFCVLVILTTTFAPKLFSRPVFAVAGPLFKVRMWFGDRLYGIGQSFSNKNALIAENNDLKGKLYQANVKLLIFDALQNENNTIKASLGRLTDSHVILGSVLANPGFSAYDTFIVDVGKAENIVVGEKVTIDGILMVGFISEVHEHTSLATLYSSPGQKLNVYVQGKNALLSAEGKGGGMFTINIPKEEVVTIGTPVLMPGGHSTVVGTISAIQPDLVHSQTTLFFRLPVNLNEVRNVFIEPNI